MADNPPISTTSPETVTVDTGADKETAQSLHSAFDDFWAEQDADQPESKTAEPAEPPPAPSAATKEGAKGPKGPQSPVGEPPEPKPEAKPVETKPPEAETKQPFGSSSGREPPAETKPTLISEAPAVSDEMIRAMELPPNARPELQEQFSKVKEMWFADRARAQAMRQEAEKLNSQLTEARANQMTAEIKADYEHAAGIRRKYDLVSDPGFIQKFDQPIIAHYHNLLDEVAKVLPDPNEGAKWAAGVKQYWQSPLSLTKEWWQRDVLANIPDELDRSTCRDQVSELLKLQRDRAEEIHKNTQGKDSFDRWNQDRVQFTAQRVQEEIMSEIGVQEKTAPIQEILPRDPQIAKTNEERAAIEKHNERFNRLNTLFQDTVRDISEHGPKAWVRASVQAARAALLFENNTNLMKELESVTNERDQLKKELEKIHGARKRIANTTGTPVLSPEQQKKNGSTSGLSVRDLDVRKAFKDYDWGDR